MGGAVLARLQAGLGAGGVWRGQESPRAGGSHLETRHCPLQQVKNSIIIIIIIIITTSESPSLILVYHQQTSAH